MDLLQSIKEETVFEYVNVEEGCHEGRNFSAESFDPDIILPEECDIKTEIEDTEVDLKSPYLFVDDGIMNTVSYTDEIHNIETNFANNPVSEKEENLEHIRKEKCPFYIEYQKLSVENACQSMNTFPQNEHLEIEMSTSNGTCSVSNVCDSAGPTYNCTECDSYFDWKDQLLLHITEVHRKLKSLKCSECDKSFEDDISFSKHCQETHKDLKPYKCKECQYCFRWRSHLSRHIQAVHKKLRPFTCAECDFSYSTKRYLTEHIEVVHRKVKPFYCKKCNKYFGRRNAFTTHIQTVHKKLKAFTCTECGKSFGQRGSLSMHVKAIHMKLKPFKCMECEKPFDSKINLLRHIKAIHGKE